MLERLKVCWHALTKQNYAFFAINENALVFDEQGNYNHINEGDVAAYSRVSHGHTYLTSNGKKKFKYFFWGAISDFANAMKQ